MATVSEDQASGSGGKGGLLMVDRVCGIEAGGFDVGVGFGRGKNGRLLSAAAEATVAVRFKNARLVVWCPIIISPVTAGAYRKIEEKKGWKNEVPMRDKSEGDSCQFVR